MNGLRSFCVGKPGLAIANFCGENCGSVGAQVDANRDGMQRGSQPQEAIGFAGAIVRLLQQRGFFENLQFVGIPIRLELAAPTVVAEGFLGEVLSCALQKRTARNGMRSSKIFRMDESAQIFNKDPVTA